MVISIVARRASADLLCEPPAEVQLRRCTELLVEGACASLSGRSATGFADQVVARMTASVTLTPLASDALKLIVSDAQVRLDHDPRLDAAAYAAASRRLCALHDRVLTELHSRAATQAAQELTERRHAVEEALAWFLNAVLRWGAQVHSS
jgi:hypothetical protein